MGAKRASSSQPQSSPRPKGRPRKDSNQPQTPKETPKSREPKGSKSAPKAKASREPKQTPKEPAPVAQPIPDCCIPVLGLLGMSSELPASCRALVSDVVRHSGLEKEASNRHVYQESFLKVLSESFAEVQASRQQALNEVEASIANHETTKTEAASKVEAAKEKADALRADRDAKHEAVLSSGKALQAAEAAKTFAKEQVKNHKAEHEQSQADLEKFTRLVMTKFVPLKEFSFPGKQWRVREKAAQEFTGALTKAEAGMEESLAHALFIAFKKRPADSEKFASQAIEFAEKLVTKHLEKLEGKIKGFEGEAQSRAAAETAAAEALVAAKTHQDGATDDFIAADNTLLEATTAVDTAATEEKSLDSKAAEFAGSLEKAKAQLAQVTSLIDSFEASRAGPSPAAAAPTEETSAEVNPAPANVTD